MPILKMSLGEAFKEIDRKNNTGPPLLTGLKSGFPGPTFFLWSAISQDNCDVYRAQKGGLGSAVAPMDTEH